MNAIVANVSQFVLSSAFLIPFRPVIVSTECPEQGRETSVRFPFPAQFGTLSAMVQGAAGRLR